MTGLVNSTILPAHTWLVWLDTLITTKVGSDGMFVHPLPAFLSRPLHCLLHWADRILAFRKVERVFRWSHECEERAGHVFHTWFLRITKQSCSQSCHAVALFLGRRSFLPQVFWGKDFPLNALTLSVKDWITIEFPFNKLCLWISLGRSLEDVCERYSISLGSYIVAKDVDGCSWGSQDRRGEYEPIPASNQCQSLVGQYINAVLRPGISGSRGERPYTAFGLHNSVFRRFIEIPRSPASLRHLRAATKMNERGMQTGSQWTAVVRTRQRDEILPRVYSMFFRWILDIDYSWVSHQRTWLILVYPA